MSARGAERLVAACGFSLGHLAFTQLAARTATVAGWRQTYVLVAGLLAASLVAFAFTLRDAPAAPGRAPPAAPPHRPAMPHPEARARMRPSTAGRPSRCPRSGR